MVPSKVLESARSTNGGSCTINVKCTSCNQELQIKIGFVCVKNKWFCPICLIQDPRQMEMIQKC